MSCRGLSVLSTRSAVAFRHFTKLRCGSVVGALRPAVRVTIGGRRPARAPVAPDTAGEENTEHVVPAEPEPSPVRHAIGRTPNADARLLPDVREKRDAFLERLRLTTDWKLVWILYSRLSRSVLRQHAQEMIACHAMALRRLDTLLRAEDVSSGAMIQVLTSKEFVMLDRSVEMELIIYRAMSDRLYRASIEDVCYTLRKLGPLLQNANQAVHVEARQCMRAYLQRLNELRHMATPQDLVSAAYGCYKANVQFGAVMTYANMSCISSLDKLDVRALQWLCYMAVDGREKWGEWKKNSTCNQELVRAILADLQRRGDDVPTGSLVGMLAKLMAVEDVFDVDNLKKIDVTLCDRVLDLGPGTISDLARLYSRCNFTTFEFDFTLRLGSLQQLLPPERFHRIVAFLVRADRLSQEALRCVALHVTHALPQYSTEDMGDLATLLIKPILIAHPDVVQLAGELAKEVSRRPHYSGKECQPLLAFLTRFDHISPRLQMKLATLACTAMKDLSVAQVASLLYTLGDMHTTYLEELFGGKTQANVYVDQAKTPAGDQAKTPAGDQANEGADKDNKMKKKRDPVDPRRRIKYEVCVHLPKASFKDEVVDDAIVHRLAMGSSRLSIYWTDLLKLVSDYVSTNWVGMLSKNPRRTIETITALSELNYGAPKLFLQYGKHLSNTCTPMEKQSSVMPSDAERFPHLYYVIGATSPHMISAVWSCVVQGVLPREAIHELFMITPNEIKDLPLRKAQYLFHIHALSMEQEQREGCAPYKMKQKSLETLRGRMRGVQFTTDERQFITDMSEHLGMFGLKMPNTNDGARVGNAMLLRDSKMMRWLPEFQKKLHVSVHEVVKTGFTPVAIQLITRADNVFRSKRRLGVCSTRVRALCALGWKVMEVPKKEWDEASTEERSNLLSSLPIMDGSEVLETHRGIQFDLTGEIIPDLVDELGGDDDVAASEGAAVF